MKVECLAQGNNGGGGLMRLKPTTEEDMVFVSWFITTQHLGYRNNSIDENYKNIIYTLLYQQKHQKHDPSKIQEYH